MTTPRKSDDHLVGRFNLTRTEMWFLGLIVLPWCIFVTITSLQAQQFMSAGDRFTARDGYDLEKRMQVKLEEKVDRIENKLDAILTKLTAFQIEVYQREKKSTQ